MRGLLHDAEYLELAGAQRGLLHRIWVEAMDSPQRRARDSTTPLGHRLGMRVTRATLERLVASAFIELAGAED